MIQRHANRLHDPSPSDQQKKNGPEYQHRNFSVPRAAVWFGLVASLGEPGVK